MEEDEEMNWTIKTSKKLVPKIFANLETSN